MNAVPSSIEDGYGSPVDTAPKPPPQRPKHRHILPGFRLTLGFTLFYLSAIVVIPLVALVLKTVTPTAEYPGISQVVGHVAQIAFSTRALDSYRLTFGLSFGAALLNGFFGFIAAWALVRYQFPGRKVIDAMVDLPFAMPTSVAGLSLAMIFSVHGILGRFFNEDLHWQLAGTPWIILIALTFVGFPFVVRTLQPILSNLAVEVEEAAACLGANRWQTFRRVIFPALGPGLLTGVMLAFGRAVGEYGSIVFISNMVPGYTEITPAYIINELDQYDYVGAAGLGLVMLLLSFGIIAAVNLVQYQVARRRGLS